MSQKKLQVFNFTKHLILGLAIISVVAAVQFLLQTPQSTQAHHASDCSDVYTPLSSFVTEGVGRNKSFYTQVMNETGVPWEMLAAIHYRETNFSHTNPTNGQGIFQFVNGNGGPYPAGAVSDGEFVRQLRFMANSVQNDYVNRGSTPRERRQLVANEQNVAIVKDTLFSYNGRATAYTDQAAHFGYNPGTQPYEGSPYVMNRFDCPRARMGIITRDYGAGIDGLDARYGAFTVFARLRGDGYRNSLLQPLSAQLVSTTTYIDPNRTQPFPARVTVRPGGKAYVRVKIVNTGYETWNKSLVKIGTTNPHDSNNKLYDTSWLSTNRAAQLIEPTVAPGGVGTFDFAITGPTTGTFTGHFAVVVEGRGWLDNLGLGYGINVVSTVSASNASNTRLASGEELKSGEYLLSPDSQTTLQLQEDGNLVLKTNFIPVWSSRTSNTLPKRLIMQGDGNLVLYGTQNQALWHTSTSSSPNSELRLQADGNMVLYNQTQAPIWSTGTISMPDNFSYTNQALTTGRVALPGQQVETANRRYRAILQKDGNFVLYSGTRALWSSGTSGTDPGFLIMQSDGNLVIYAKNYQPIWSSRTSNRGPSHLEVQEDGNLVMYNNRGIPTWSSGTSGQ